MVCDAPECATDTDDVQRVVITLPSGRYVFDLCQGHRQPLGDLLSALPNKTRATRTPRQRVIHDVEDILNAKKRGTTHIG